MDPATALTMLQDGHTRFITGRMEHPRQSDERRADVAQRPSPFAIIFGCADTRVPPEILFDQGIGDLFVVRLAGNVVTDEVLGSIEVAVQEMGAPLLIVLGHTRCAAVRAAVEAQSGEGEAGGHVGSIVEALLPAVAGVGSTAGDRFGAAVRENVRRAAAMLRASEPVLAPAVREGTLEVHGWLYDVETGLIEMLV
jgi:carbonic anhydrase